MAGTSASVDIADAITIEDVSISSIAPGDNNIGNVDIVSLPALPMVPGGSRETGTTPYTPSITSVRSISVVVLVDEVEVDWGAGGAFILPAGTTMSWGAAGAHDLYLSGVPTFTGQDASSDYIVTWITH